MANGHFLGGMAEARDTRLAGERADAALAQEGALRSRGLGLQERQLEQQGKQSDRSFSLEEKALGLKERAMKNAERNEGLAKVEAAIASTMQIASKTVEAAIQAGRTPEEIRKAVTPLLVDAQGLAQRIGRDPASLARQLDAAIQGPNPVDVAKVEGKAAAAKQKAMTEGGMPLLKPEQKVTVENTLRTDYVARSKPFIEANDAFNRIQAIEATGAGDVALLYSFMKMLDPASTVREGEVAMAQQAAGVPATVMNLYNSVVKGERLPPHLRDQFKTQAKKIFDTQALQHQRVKNQYTDIAKRQGADPANVTVDFTTPPAAAPPAGGTGNFPEPPPGFNVVK